MTQNLRTALWIPIADPNEIGDGITTTSNPTAHKSLSTKFAAGGGGAAGPAGPQGPAGPTGPAGPSTPSANAGNLATLGTDNLLLVSQATLDARYVQDLGTVAADNAAPGVIGEVLSASNASAVTLATNVTSNITNFTLSAGDWDVEGVATVTHSVNMGSVAVAISIASATLPTLTQIVAGTGSMNQLHPTFTSAQTEVIQAGRCRVNVSSTTNIYLVCQAGFASGTATATGYIWARRMR